jgi:hypothetical protein
MKVKESSKKGQRKGKGKEMAGKASRRMEGVKASTVMFVPWTSKGKLISRLKEEEERLVGMTGFKVKYHTRRRVERLYGSCSPPPLWKEWPVGERIV